MNRLISQVPKLFRVQSSQLAGRCRFLSTEGSAEQLTEGEQKVSSVLKEKFPDATYIKVQDVSGGCGSMYDVQIEAPDFAGKRQVLQHKMVNEALKEEIKSMHGLRIFTAVSK